MAHRTSPTNIGLQLMSTLAAHDFGYISFAGVLDRLEPTFATLLALPRYRGHFYNRYDTRRLEPLVPAYISTVDSGNLAGYLLTLKSGLAGIIDHTPIIGANVLDGLDDVVLLFEESLMAASTGRSAAAGRVVSTELADLRRHLAERPASLGGWSSLLD